MMGSFMQFDNHAVPAIAEFGRWLTPLSGHKLSILLDGSRRRIALRSKLGSKVIWRRFFSRRAN